MLALVIMITLLYFETRIISEDITSRNSGRTHLELLGYKFCLVLAHNFFWQPQFEIIILFVIGGGSILMFFRFHTNSPFYNKDVAILWEVLTGLGLWTSFMLILARIIEKALI